MAKVITEKLISRHPHVFGDTKVSGSDEVVANWEEIKAAEKGRTSALDGVAISQPALSLINKLLYRAEKYGVEIDVPTYPESLPATSESVGSALLAVISWAHKNGIDPEDALRMQSKQIMREIAQQEAR